MKTKRSAAGWPGRDIRRVMISRAAISRRVKSLGRRISRDFAGESITLVCVLKGSVMLAADLMRVLEIPCSIDFMAVSSYAGAESTGSVRVAMDLRESPAGKNVLLVEGVVDTGLTLATLKNILLARNVKSLRVCALLDKPDCHRVPVSLDYMGFSIPNEFVVGYGLDYGERYRNLPYIGILREEIYKSPKGRK